MAQPGALAYDPLVRPHDLADPSYEPSDEELAELMRSAFAEVSTRQEAAEREMRNRIAVARAEALRGLRRRPFP